jgi:ornithine carbamoyltransferase
LKSKDFLSISDLTRESIRTLIQSAIGMKADGWSNLLSEKVLVLLFEKPSLRTRVSFEVGMRQLGGECIYLSPDEVRIGKRESVVDIAMVLSRYADVIAARVYSHDTLKVMAAKADIPIINALSDMEHPCQALADMMTIFEHKNTLEGLTLAYVGDGNNCAASLMLAASLCGMNFRIASPKGYHVDDKILRTAQQYALENGAEIFSMEEPQQAVVDVDVVYTDVWTSMGQEDEAETRRKIFAPYQVNKKLLALAKPDAILMHDLPAHHGEEVEENIIYSDQSVVFDQAENRLHAQKAVLAYILGGLEISLPGYR